MTSRMLHHYFQYTSYKNSTFSAKNELPGQLTVYNTYIPLPDTVSHHTHNTTQYMQYYHKWTIKCLPKEMKLVNSTEAPY